MADKTPNLGLMKPLLTEKYDVGIFNGNADIVDAAITEANRKISELRDISPPAEHFADYTQGGMFDLSIMTEKMRFEILYDASTEFEDAPDLLYLDDSGTGRIMFEVEELPEGYAQQTIICLAGSGAVFRRTGVGVEWDEWRAVCSPCMAVKVQFGSGTEIDLSEEIAAHFPWESKAYSYADVYSASPSAPGAYFTDGKLHLNNSPSVTLTYNLLFREAYDSGIIKLQAHESKTTIHTTAAEKELWNSASERAATNESALAEEIARAKEAEAINRSSIGLQKKNLLKNDYYSGYSETINGVTFTVNSDGSITANGTATAYVEWYCCGEKMFENCPAIKKGDYILSGCPSGGANTTYILNCMYKTIGETQSGSGVYVTGGETTLTVPYDTVINAAICIITGTTVENLTFYPMLRSADIADSTYEEYTPSLQEQVETLQNDVGKDADDLANYILANEDAHYDLGLRVTAAEEAITALETSVSSKLNRFRKWMEGSISVDIGSATLIEISGVSTVGIAHRHYLKLVRIGNETAVLEESKGAGTGVSYTYTIEDNILTVTNTGSYGHNITVIY